MPATEISKFMKFVSIGRLNVYIYLNLREYMRGDACFVIRSQTIYITLHPLLHTIKNAEKI